MDEEEGIDSKYYVQLLWGYKTTFFFHNVLGVSSNSIFLLNILFILGMLHIKELD